MPSGPQSGSASTNYPRGIETGVNWCTKLLQYMRAHGYTRAEPTLEAQERWTAHVKQMYSAMLMRKAKSWFTGYNSNVPGHEHGKTRYLVYNGGSPKYVANINASRKTATRESPSAHARPSSATRALRTQASEKKCRTEGLE